MRNVRPPPPCTDASARWLLPPRVWCQQRLLRRSWKWHCESRLPFVLCIYQSIVFRAEQLLNSQTARLLSDRHAPGKENGTRTVLDLRLLKQSGGAIRDLAHLTRLWKHERQLFYYSSLRDRRLVYEIWMLRALSFRFAITTNKCKHPR